MIALLGLAIGMSALLAFLMGLGFYFINPVYGWAAFWITFALEWIVMEPVNRMLRIKALREEQKTISQITELEEVASQQSVALECEFCGEVNAVPISLNKSNAFECKKCNNENKVLLQFTTVRPTNPLESITPQQLDEISEKELNDE